MESGMGDLKDARSNTDLLSRIRKNAQDEGCAAVSIVLKGKQMVDEIFEQSFLHEGFQTLLMRPAELVLNVLRGSRRNCEVLKTTHDGDKVRKALSTMGRS